VAELLANEERKISAARISEKVKEFFLQLVKYMEPRYLSQVHRQE
jgi:hypothetical protein